MIFDLLSKEYGWTTRDILDMTFWELNRRLETINKRNGATTEEKKSFRSDLTPDQTKAMDLALDEARKRIRKEERR